LFYTLYLSPIVSDITDYVEITYRILKRIQTRHPFDSNKSWPINSYFFCLIWFYCTWYTVTSSCSYLRVHLYKYYTYYNWKPSSFMFAL